MKHPLHNIQDEEKAKEIAQQFNLVQTGGSDFHGFYGDSEVSIGSINIGIEYLALLEKRKEEIQMKV